METKRVLVEKAGLACMVAGDPLVVKVYDSSFRVELDYRNL